MRRRSRECALKILYQWDVGQNTTDPTADPSVPDTQHIDELLDAFFSNFDSVSADEQAFAERLVRGVLAERSNLDHVLKETSHHWKLERMDCVDLNLLRLGAYELLHCPDIPAAVTINEAVEIAKRFSGLESASFINGILDKLEKQARASKETGS